MSVAVCPACFSPYDMDSRLSMDSKNQVHVQFRPLNCPTCEHQVLFSDKHTAMIKKPKTKKTSARKVKVRPQH